MQCACARIERCHACSFETASLLRKIDTQSSALFMQNRIDWTEHLLRGMWRTQNAESSDSAYSELSALLMDLGDPYTRIVPGR